MSTQPTDAMIEAGAYEFQRQHSGTCYPEAMPFEQDNAAEAIYLAMQSARTPPPCAGDDVERVATVKRLLEKIAYTATPLNSDDEAVLRINSRDAANMARAAIAALGTTPSIVGQEKLDG